MAVDQGVSRARVNDELLQVRDYARACRWGIIPELDRLVVLVTMHAHDGDLFIVEVHLDDYKEKPPLFEFVDPDTGQRGTRHAYPKTTDSFFHDSGPCICAPFNRKAYKEVVGTGPHHDWKLGDWTTSTANGYNWSNASKLGDMLGMIYARLSRPECYRGRMSG